MAKREKSTNKQASKRKDEERTEKDLGLPKEKSGKVKGGRIYSSSDVRLKRAIRPL